MSFDDHHQSGPQLPTFESTLPRETREWLDVLTQTELVVVALYLYAGSMTTREFQDCIDQLRVLSRRALLKTILDLPASQIAATAIHVMAGSFHPRRLWMKHRTESTDTHQPAA